MKDETLEMTVLLDFFGELLTEKQRRCFELYYCEDLSLSEIAQLEGVTRQGVRDNISRARAAMEETEAKTGVVSKWNKRRTELAKLSELAVAIEDKTSGEVAALAAALRSGLRELEN